MPELADVIDMEMTEGIYSKYDFEQIKYLKQSSDVHKYYLQLLKAAKDKKPRLQSFEYCQPSSKKPTPRAWKLKTKLKSYRSEFPNAPN